MKELIDFCMANQAGFAVSFIHDKRQFSVTIDCAKYNGNDERIMGYGRNSSLQEACRYAIGSFERRIDQTGLTPQAHIQFSL